MSGSNSSYWETTYSEDQRIELCLKTLHEEEIQYQNDLREYRRKLFDRIYTERTELIFTFGGLHFLYFTNEKIKFYFRPSDIAKFVSRKTKFYCKLVHYEKYQWWGIKMDSFPVNYKRKIYALFNSNFDVGDGDIIGVIARIYKVLLIWTRKEELYRQDKIRKYKRGELEDMDLDSVDLELFFSENEKMEWRSRRNAILKRMLPPDKRDDFEEIEQMLSRESSDSGSD